MIGYDPGLRVNRGIINIEADIFAPPGNPRKLEKSEKFEKSGKSVRATPRGCPYGESNNYGNKHIREMDDYLGQGQTQGPVPTVPTTNAGDYHIPVIIAGCGASIKWYADGVKNNGWPPWIKEIEHPANPGVTIQIRDDICKEV